MNGKPHDFRDSPDAAPRLRDELRSLYAPQLRASTEIDRRIERATRIHFAQTRRVARFHRLTPFAAAAALMLAVLWMPSPTAPEDVDGNGRVDILDAFVLARRLKTSAAIQPAWDVTGDGRVDAADVDAIAMAAVRLSKG